MHSYYAIILNTYMYVACCLFHSFFLFFFSLLFLLFWFSRDLKIMCRDKWWMKKRYLKTNIWLSIWTRRCVEFRVAWRIWVMRECGFDSNLIVCEYLLLRFRYHRHFSVMHELSIFIGKRKIVRTCLDFWAVAEDATHTRSEMAKWEAIVWSASRHSVLESVAG